LWARALKATDQTLRKQLLSKLPVRRAGMIAGAMAEIRTTRLDSIEKARQQILKTALSLAAKHKISFAGKGIH
jgi:flagellar motor switch protein FliG